VTEFKKGLDDLLNPEKQHLKLAIVRATLLSQGDNLYLGLAKGNPK
jgi:hypothetical protein